MGALANVAVASLAGRRRAPGQARRQDPLHGEQTEKDRRRGMAPNKRGSARFDSAAWGWCARDADEFRAAFEHFAHDVATGCVARQPGVLGDGRAVARNRH
jgi:hypothetical protein